MAAGFPRAERGLTGKREREANTDENEANSERFVAWLVVGKPEDDNERDELRWERRAGG